MTIAVLEARMLFPRNEVLGLARDECQDRDGDTGEMEIAVALQLQEGIVLAVEDGVLQHSATQCNRLQHCATHCNTLVSGKHAHHHFAVTRVGISPSSAHTPRFSEALTQEALTQEALALTQEASEALTQEALCHVPSGSCLGLMV